MFKRSKFRGFIKNMDFILAALTFAAAVFGIIMLWFNRARLFWERLSCAQ